MTTVISSGTRLGRYEIRKQIGAGGMGVVYLARDAELDRTVALKILPAEVASNGERMRRFVQEAKAAAALNHPHIAHIYEIGKAGETNFIAMEFVDGTTLREKMHEREDLRRLLKYLAQVADGLAKAHASGIVHRDLKPENIMIAREGYAKILDFGLAKLIETERTEAADTALHDAPTAMMQQHSQPGVVMGTAGYMSPEQAEGKNREIDHRSDIFSFGCILFEAVTGHRPFEADSVIKTLHKVVYEPAPPIKDFNPDAPAELQRIVRRCLMKDPDERFQTIKDVAIELKEVRREMAEGAGAEIDTTVPPPSKSDATASRTDGQAATLLTVTASGPTDETTAARNAPSSAQFIISEIRQHKRGAALALLLLALLCAASTFGLYKLFSRNNPSQSPAQPFENVNLTRVTSSGKVTHAAISPDGKYIAHVLFDNSQQSIWVRQTSATNDINIVPPSSAEIWGLTFSRDSNDVYYVAREPNSPGALYRIPALGGTAHKLITSVDSPVTLSPDGQRFAFVRGDFPAHEESALVMANADGSGEQVLAKRKLPDFFYPIYFTGPSWSPDGELIACATRHYQDNRYFKNVIAVRVKDGTEQVLTERDWFFISRVEWMPDGRGLLMIAQDQGASPRQIWYLSYPQGDARRITNDLNEYRTLSVTTDMTKLLSVRITGTSSIWAAPGGDTTRARQVVTGQDEGLRGLCLTPDGKIVYASTSSQAPDLWIADPTTGSRKQLTANAGGNASPAASPDGRYIVFVSTRSGTQNIWRMDMDGGNQKQLTHGLGDDTPCFTPDGKWVIYSSSVAGVSNYRGSGTILMKVSVDGGEPVLLNDKFSYAPSVSPDGKLIACIYQDNPAIIDPLPNQIAIIPIEGGAPVKIFTFHNNGTTGARVHWSTDGRAVLYNEARNNVSNIWSQPIAGGPPKQLTNFTDNLIRDFDWLRDQLVCARGAPVRDAILISNVK